MREWRSILEPVLRKAHLRPEEEADVIAELSDHLDDRYRELCARGLSEDDATAAIVREIEADPEFARRVRTERGRAYVAPAALGATAKSSMAGVSNDIRIGMRLLRRNPVFAIAAILTIALAIGANTALYSTIRSLLLRPLPYPDPSSLALVQLVSKRPDEARSDTLQAWSYPKYVELRANQRVFSDLAGYETQDVTIRDGGTTERRTIEIASASYFPMLGVHAQIGRLYGSIEDANAGEGAVLVLANDTWREQYGADPSVVGRTLSLNGKPFTVIGVASPSFKGLGGVATAWVPMSAAPTLLYPEVLTERGNHWFGVIGRKRDGAAAKSVAASLQETFRRINSVTGAPEAGTIVDVPLDARRASDVMRRTLIVLFGAAMLTLLIACANIASLLVSRGSSRQQELSVRFALGAGRWRVARQLIAESMVLAFAGGAFGLLLGVLGNRFVQAITPALAGDTMKGLLAVRPPAFDAPVLLFTLFAIVFTGLATGVAPAFRASRTELSGSLRDGSRNAGHSRSTVRTRFMLIIFEGALAMVLLTGAGLLLRTFAHYRAIDTGIDPDHVLTWRVAVPENDTRSAEELASFYDDIARRISAIKGVTGVTTDRCLPLSAACPSTVATAAGDRTFAVDVAPGVDLHFVLPAHLDALHLPLRRGRMFNERDRAGAPKVVLLSESAARSLFGAQDPIGKTIQLATAFLKGDAKAEIVGVVADARYGELTAAPAAAVYAPTLQFASRSMYMMARTEFAPELLAPMVRSVVREAADVPVMKVLTLEEHLGTVLARTRILASVLTAFAAFAFILAVIGVFGVIAASVEQRRGEIGIRIALGATPSNVANLVAASGFGFFGVGVLIGVPAALAAARLLRGLLYGIAPTDGLTYGIVITGLLLAGALAAWIPSRRAAAVDPGDALRAG